MLAVYDGKLYNWSSTRRGSYIMTYDKDKTDGSFEQRNGYYIKRVESGDGKLSSIFKVHFMVVYTDRTEGRKEWIVDEGVPLHEVPHIEDNEVGLWNNGTRHGEGWTVCDKYACSKIVHLDECEKFTVETEYLLEDGKYLPEAKKVRRAVSADEFRERMISHRRKNV